MFAARRLAAVFATVLAMVLSTLAVWGSPVSADPGSPDATQTQESQESQDAPAAQDPKPRAKAPRPDYSWTPKKGPIFNTPDTKSKRAILAHVIQSVRSTRPGQSIRMAMWNFDDKPARIELIRAHKRGVSVQVLVSAQVDNPNFTALRKGLARKSPNARKQPAASWGRRCNAGCRTPRGKGIMHTKFFLFSKVGRAKNIVMFGSINLTTAAGNRQWNDLTTFTNATRLRKHYGKLFMSLRKDKPVYPPYRVYHSNKTVRTNVFPLNKKDVGGPILRDFKAVKCKGAARGYGNRAGRTKIRIAIAGWFDEYGARIARQVRRLWNRGCDIKIVNTLTGRGINKALKDRSGRGPVPNREVTRDRNADGIPERYLHLKYYTIDGVYGRDKSSRLYFTGSANWSARARRSDEIYVRVKKSGWTRRYANHVDRLFRGRYAHKPMTTVSGRPIPGHVAAGMLQPHEVFDPKNDHLVPDWFETD